MTITRSAAVVPRLPDGRVLTGHRTLAARSFPGYLAFPGGATDDGDEDLPRASKIDAEARERGAALRELGEESGRWLLCAPDGAPAPDSDTTRFARALSAESSLLDALRDTGLVLDDRALVPLGRWVTPDFLPHRFSVRQFLLPLAADPGRLQTPTPELTELTWRSPQDLVAAWRAGDALLLPPIRFVIERLFAAAEGGHDTDTLVAALSRVPDANHPKLRDIVVGAAVQPYRTPTLPPAKHTNTVLLGAGDFLIVDPATPYDDERARFDALLDALAKDGRRARAIVLTHHHHDHVGDVERLAETRGLEVWAHEKTAELVDFEVQKTIVDDELLVCDGDPPRRYRALFTPGHAAGHLCFLDEDTGVLVAGDMVASVGSILIDPDEGHMGTYLSSLERLIGSGVRRVIPSHGPMLADGKARLEEQLAHRERRHEQVRAALPAGDAMTPIELVPGIYGDDTPEALFPLAARSVLSALVLLEERGHAKRDGDRWRATSGAT